MKDLQDFLLRCSGADPAILKKSPTDVNKYIGIGGTVVFTAILAALAATYAAWTVSDSIVMAVVFGLIWGLMIFNLDRYIVSSLKRRGSIWKDVLYATPRLAIAVVIAMVISTPVELKLFEKEIDGEIILMEQEMFAAQEDALRARYQEEFDRINSELAVIETEIASAEALYQKKSGEAVSEADGTGGSMRRNMGPIYALKKAEADKAKAALDELRVIASPKIESLENKKSELEQEVKNEIASLERSSMDGLAYRMEGLERITSKYPPVKTGHLFIVFLFLLIESAPVLVKLISSRSAYDYHLHVHEHVVEMYHKEVTSKRSNATEASIKYDHEVTMYDIHGEIKVKRAQIDEEVKRKIARIKGQADPETSNG